MGDLGPEVIEVIEDEDEAADEDAEVEEARAASPQGDWLASDGDVSPVPWASSDEDSFTSSSDIAAMSEEEVKDTPCPAASVPPLPPAV